MDNSISLLIYLSDGEQLFDVALKLEGNALTEDEKTYFLESENKKKLMSYLPIHCQELGKIVDVREIFEVVDNRNARAQKEAKQ
jgi:hypothetical protein